MQLITRTILGLCGFNYTCEMLELPMKKSEAQLKFWMKKLMQNYFVAK